MESKKKVVVVLGKGELAVRVADWFRTNPSYTLGCVVPNQPPSSWTAQLDVWANERGVPVVESGLADDVPLEMIDIAVSVTYDKIIRPSFIGRCGRIINIHNGPLPRYRGVNPINWALKNGESEHGVTIHEITPGVDDGPILGQIMFPIDPEMDEVIDVYQRCMDQGWQLFEDVMARFQDIVPEPQDDSQATHYTKKDFPGLRERSFFTRAESINKLGLN